MNVIRARNAHQMLPEVMHQLKQKGEKRQSRNGPVLQLTEPTTMVFDCPLERVVFWPERSANPFFHLLEALWMLAGRNDVKFLASIVPSIKQFSDNGDVFHGAYGHRWRKWFDFDQLEAIADNLKKNPDCRRQVLSMWSATADLSSRSKDVPCNTHVYFSRDRDGVLNMTVCNRSNDVVWGALGANVVHFSVLQEFLAHQIGCDVGRYWQVTNNLHLYTDRHAGLMEELAQYAFPSNIYRLTDRYAAGHVRPYPATFSYQDVHSWVNSPYDLGHTDPFLRKVALPMKMAVAAFVANEPPDKYDRGLGRVAEMPEDCDWRIAAETWLRQKREAWEEKQNVQ